jgi:hypothetical protein|tara:strand:- start:434 stop:772 length:339 start_codon:yes stop_codon:yes gene_type:complete
MNPLDKLTDNAVMGFGFLGAFTGQLLGGSTKERTNQIVLYGALGAAAGYFFNKSREQRLKAIVSAAGANAKAIEAVQLATQAKQLSTVSVAPKVKVLGSMGHQQFMTGAALF